MTVGPVFGVTKLLRTLGVAGLNFNFEETVWVVVVECSGRRGLGRGLLSLSRATDNVLWEEEEAEIFRTASSTRREELGTETGRGDDLAAEAAVSRLLLLTERPPFNIGVDETELLVDVPLHDDELRAILEVILLTSAFITSSL